MKHAINVPLSAISDIFNIIRYHSPITRSNILQKTNFSKSTVNSQINKLLQMNLITEEQRNPSSVRNNQLEIHSNIGYVIGVFLGINKVSIALFNLKLDIIDWHFSNLDSIVEPEQTNKIIIHTIDDFLYKNSIGKTSLWGIGMGFPFPIDFDRGIPDSPPNLPRWDRFPLREIYEKHFNTPVVIDNDVNVMAMGEKFSGVSHSELNSIFVKIGTGIGAGLLVDGKIYRGANGCAGDIGHIGIDGDNTMCHCGKLGCLEAVASGTAVAEKGFLLAQSGKSKHLALVLAKGGTITAAEVSIAADLGDINCIALLQTCAKYTGSILAKLVNFFNPSIIVIGGGFAKTGNYFLASIRDNIISRSLHLATYSLKVQYSKLLDRAGPIGCGVLIFDNIFSSNNFQDTVDRRLSL